MIVADCDASIAKERSHKAVLPTLHVENINGQHVHGEDKGVVPDHVEMNCERAGR